MANHRVQGFKVSKLWPAPPQNVEQRSACERLPTKSEDAYAQCALKIGPGIAIPGALPGPEHGVWAPMSSLSWSLTVVTAARPRLHHPSRARSRGRAQSEAIPQELLMCPENSEAQADGLLKIHVWSRQPRAPGKCVGSESIAASCGMSASFVLLREFQPKDL